MGARKGEPKGLSAVERRRQFVRHLRFGLELTYVAIVEKLKTRGISTTRATVARDCELLKREFAAFTQDFDPLAAIGERAERFRIIAARAIRFSVKTADDGHRAKLLRVATDGDERGSRTAPDLRAAAA